MPKTHRNSLQPGYKLHWYRIEEILGQGGFGITYLALDLNLNKEVAIKEYLPIEMAVREGNFSVHPVTENHSEQFQWGLDRFLKEARILAQFDHPNIVRVNAVFEENNTGYMVMNYEHGLSLAEKLKGRRTLEEGELIRILFPILGGLEQMHASGFIHRDIKPDNIFIRQDGSPVLLDFGSARQALGGETKTLTSLVTPGYAPFEQYYAKSDEQGPWTDIYGLAATLYRAVTGIAPMDAVDRSNALLKRKNDTYVSVMDIAEGKYSERFLTAVDNALQFNTEERPQSVSEWRQQFGLPDAPLKGANIDNTPTQPGTRFDLINKVSTDGWIKTKRTKKTKRRGTFGRIFLSLLLVASLVFAGFFFQPQIEQLFNSWQQQQQVERLLLDARSDMQAKRFIQPVDNNAVNKFQKILQLKPDHTEAQLGLEKINNYLSDLISTSIQDKAFGRAEELLAELKIIFPDAGSTKRLMTELQEARNAHEQNLADEKARDEKLQETVRKANLTAAAGDATQTLLLIVQSQSLGASTETVDEINKRLWLTLDLNISQLDMKAKYSEDVNEAKHSLEKMKSIKAQLDGLPIPDLDNSERLERTLSLANYAASEGIVEATMGYLAEAQSLGANIEIIDSIKNQLKNILESRADEFSTAARKAVENNDIESARIELKKAKEIKAQIETL